MDGAGKALADRFAGVFSLGKKESRSKNPRMGKVAACTERAREILSGQSVYFTWNEGGHFHDIEGRFAKAIMWWMEGFDG